jgi:hypothetical protein
MPRDLVVTLVKEQSCTVIVRDVPDEITSRDAALLEMAMQARGKDWECDEVKLVAAKLPTEDDDAPEVQWKQ